MTDDIMNMDIKTARPLFELIDRLRGFGLDNDINLPRVAVIGDKGAGKTSVLEAISGVQLPRGPDVVTRCPLEMRLKSANDKNTWQCKISFTDIHGKKQSTVTTEPDSVATLVQKAQSDTTDMMKGVREEPITLEVTSSDVLDLTLIELPGITKTSVRTQPKDIETMKRNLIKKYIMVNETIILAVLECNEDISTCEAFKMAKEFDSGGLRSLGVLTKPDLIDSDVESEVMTILHNMSSELPQGLVVVKCRDQDAIDQGQSLRESQNAEVSFFKHHLSKLRSDQWGVNTLADHLSHQQKVLTKRLFPELKAELRSKLSATEDELTQLGTEFPDTVLEKRQLAHMMISNFIVVVSTLTRGHPITDLNVSSDANELLSYTRQCFLELYRKAKWNKPDITDRELKEKLGMKIREFRGREFCNYMGKYEVVESFAREYVKRMHQPSLKCFDDVMDKTTDVLKNLAAVHLQAIPHLANKAKEVILKLHTKTQKSGKEEIKRYLLLENLIFSQDLTYNSELGHVDKTENIKVAKAEDTSTCYGTENAAHSFQTSLSAHEQHKNISTSKSYKKAVRTSPSTGTFGSIGAPAFQRDDVTKASSDVSFSTFEFPSTRGFGFGATAVHREDVTKASTDGPFRTSPSTGTVGFGTPAFQSEDVTKASTDVSSAESKGVFAFTATSQPDLWELAKEQEQGVNRALSSLKSYYQIATRRLCDIIPMIIQQHVFHQLVEELRKQLIHIASDDKIIECIQEDEDVVLRRQECRARLDRLQLAEEEFLKV